MRPGHLDWERSYSHNSVSESGFIAGLEPDPVDIVGIQLGIVNTGLVYGNDPVRQQGIAVLPDHPEILLFPVRQG